MKLEFLRPNQKYANIKFNENPSRGLTVIRSGLTDGQRTKTDRHDISNFHAFRQACSKILSPTHEPHTCLQHSSGKLTTGRHFRHSGGTVWVFALCGYGTQGLLPMNKHLPHYCASSKSTSGRCI